MTDRLKPCPFCGGEATTSEIEKIENMPYGWGWVGCRPCRVFMNWSHGERGKKLAIEQWNTRKPMDSIVERLEEAKGKPYTDGVHMYNENDFIDIDKAIEIVKGEV